MIIIKRDADILKMLSLKIRDPIFSISLIPFYSLFCNEVEIYFSKNNQPLNLKEYNSSKFSFKDIRQKAKFFDYKSAQKTFEMLRQIDNLNNTYFINRMRYPENGRWNVHDNIGIFFDEQGNVISNSHYGFYIFQNKKLLSKALKFDPELLQNEVKEFAKFVGSVIGSLTKGFSTVSDFIPCAIEPDIPTFFCKDFNTNRMRYNRDDRHSEKLIRLFLLHILCGINFALYGLKKAITHDPGWLLRVEYVTYYHATKELRKLITNSSNSVAQSEILKEITLEEDKYYDSDFRGCMMHYGLWSRSSKSYLEEKYCDYSLPLCGLVESMFEGISYWNFQNIIEERLLAMSHSISRYLDLDLAISE
ncbi:MAG TPA: hypothetical protein VFD78_01575 [Chitinophagaceae bacterium]|nr:hypothetical protein [Chitinophagaceae bacterium]